MQSDERIDTLDSNIVDATAVAIDSSRKMEEAGRKLAMTQVGMEGGEGYESYVFGYWVS